MYQFGISLLTFPFWIGLEGASTCAPVSMYIDPDPGGEPEAGGGGGQDRRQGVRHLQVGAVHTQIHQMRSLETGLSVIRGLVLNVLSFVFFILL